MNLGKRQRATYGRTACRAVALVAACGGAGFLRAADFTWRAAPVSASWNETDENWTGAGSVWASSSTNSATFGESAVKSVSAQPVTLKDLTFNADGYTVGGGRLTLYGVPSVTSGATAVLSATVTNVGVWAKAGGGTLVLDPGAGNTNVFFALKAATGVVQVASGTSLVIQPGSNPETAPAFWVSGGTLAVGGGLLRTTGGSFARVSDYGHLLVTNGLCDLSGNSELLNAFNSPGVTTVGGQGVLDVNRFRIVKNQAGASFSGVNLDSGGALRLNEFWFETDNPARKATINLNGGRIVGKDAAATREMLGGSAANWSNIFVNVLAGGAVFDNNGCNFYVRQKLSGTPGDGGLTKLNGGTLFLWGSNTYNGATSLAGGTLNVRDDANLGAAPSAPATNLVFLASSTLQSGANQALAAGRSVWVTNGATATFDSQAYTQLVYGTITCADTSATLAKVGSGMVVLDPGATAVNEFGTLQTSAGTLVVASGTNRVTRYCAVQNGPGLRVAAGTLLVSGGVLMTTTGKYVNVDGGHLLVTNGLVDTTSCDEVLNSIGGPGTGFTTVSGSGTLVANRIRISQNGGNPSNSVVSVCTGGVLRLAGFYIDTGVSQKGMLVLNGGAVEPRTDNADFLGTATALTGTNSDKWLTNIWVYVREGGAIFNTAGRTISVKQPLYAGAPGDGGLVKRGAGVLTLMNTNTYAGATRVEGGTLRLGVSNALLAGSAAYVSSNAVFDVNGQEQELSVLGGSGTVTNVGALAVQGTVAPGDAGSFGTLTLAAAPAALSGALSISVSTPGACDRLHVRGGLDLAPLTLNVENPEQLSKFTRYTVATCEGALAAPFGSVGALPARWLVRYNAASAYLVYDFGSLISIR